MPTQQGHTRAIAASRVQGTPVYDTAGNSIGQVEDLILDKTSNNIMFAVLGFGGFLGIGEKFHPIPWSVLTFDEDKGGYVVPIAKETLEKAPQYRLEDLTKSDGACAEIRAAVYQYYKVN